MPEVSIKTKNPAELLRGMASFMTINKHTRVACVKLKEIRSYTLKHSEQAHNLSVISHSQHKKWQRSPLFVETLDTPQKKHLCTKGAQTNSL